MVIRLLPSLPHNRAVHPDHDPDHDHDHDLDLDPDLDLDLKYCLTDCFMAIP